MVGSPGRTEMELGEQILHPDSSEIRLSPADAMEELKQSEED